MALDPSKDPFGAAVENYYRNRYSLTKTIKVFSSISGEEQIKVPYLFRTEKKMPALEQLALNTCKGLVLDIGACAGSHALALQKKGIDVTALEISNTCCGVMRKRGIKKVICANIYSYEEASYDTLLLLMNGIGLAGTIEGLKELLLHFKKLLKAGGQIIFDSSDIEYAYYEEDGSKWVDLNNTYYGQVEYTMSFKDIASDKFKWLFIDKNKMKELADELGYTFKILAEGDHYDYLGVLESFEK